MNSMFKGKYVGDCSTFIGRTALVQPVDADDRLVLAQFDEGDSAETHGWTAFYKEEWENVESKGESDASNTH